jgi:hypothetical protein
VRSALPALPGHPGFIEAAVGEVIGGEARNRCIRKNEYKPLNLFQVSRYLQPLDISKFPFIWNFN